MRLVVGAHSACDEDRCRILNAGRSAASHVFPAARTAQWTMSSRGTHGSGWAASAHGVPLSLVCASPGGRWAHRTSGLTMGTRPPPAPAKSSPSTSPTSTYPTAAQGCAARVAPPTSSLADRHRPSATPPARLAPLRPGLPHRPRHPPPARPGRPRHQQRTGPTVLPSRRRTVHPSHHRTRRWTLDTAPATALRPHPRRRNRRQHRHPAVLLRAHLDRVPRPIHPSLTRSPSPLAERPRPRPTLINHTKGPDPFPCYGDPPYAQSSLPVAERLQGGAGITPREVLWNR